ncbi:MAG: hypothetical protein ACYDHG_02595 [Desulfomonilaceae bacterium]
MFAPAPQIRVCRSDNYDVERLQRDPTDTRPVVIMTQDEGRFGWISDLRACWTVDFNRGYGLVSISDIS